MVLTIPAFEKKDVNCFGRCVASVVNDSCILSIPLMSIKRNSYLISHMKRWLNSDEIDRVCSPPTQLSRAKAFVDLITRKN